MFRMRVLGNQGGGAAVGFLGTLFGALGNGRQIRENIEWTVAGIYNLDVPHNGSPYGITGHNICIHMWLADYLDVKPLSEENRLGAGIDEKIILPMIKGCPSLNNAIQRSEEFRKQWFAFRFGLHPWYKMLIESQAVADDELKSRIRAKAMKAAAMDSISLTAQQTLSSIRRYV